MHAIFLQTLSAAHAKEATPIESYQVGGLTTLAEIVVDRYGVPHIYAATQAGAFFVQGFNAARDPLFEIDLWRRPTAALHRSPQAGMNFIGAGEPARPGVSIGYNGTIAFGLTIFNDA